MDVIRRGRRELERGESGCDTGGGEGWKEVRVDVIQRGGEGWKEVRVDVIQRGEERVGMG